LMILRPPSSSLFPYRRSSDLCSVVVQGTAIGPIVQRIGERRALLIGLSFGAIGFLIFGLAPTGWLFWLGIPVMSLWGVAGAATRSEEHTSELQSLTKLVCRLL